MYEKMLDDFKDFIVYHKLTDLIDNLALSYNVPIIAIFNYFVKNKSLLILLLIVEGSLTFELTVPEQNFIVNNSLTL